MLQIVTGKFFRDVELYRTQHRSVLYTNARLFCDAETVSGRVSRADVSRGVHTLVYEVEERLEAVTASGEPEILVSTGGDYLANDFAAVLAFALRVTCSTNVDVVRRLTRGPWTEGDAGSPARYVERIFDVDVAVKPADVERLPTFIEQLIGLERAHYREVMRAIRRYSVALQRLGDDLPLAYLLLVASIESLAQRFDNFKPTWDDFDQRKRKVVEAAIQDAPAPVSERVKAAVLEIEHVALGRRYREFALSKLRPSFFREDAAQYTGPARRRDLPKALARAYGLRSQLIHRLEELPRMLTAVPMRRDVIEIDGMPTLTFNGLARLAREVILTVVQDAPKVEKEKLDYRRELPNMITAKLAPRYWVWKADGLNAQTANAYLSGFLDELASVLRGDDDARLTDIRPVLQRIEELVPALNTSARLPLLVLYHLFHWHVSEDWRRQAFETFLHQHEQELNMPSVPSLIGHVVSSAKIDWPVHVHEKQIDRYFSERFHKRGLHVDAFFEAAILLHAAQRLLQIGAVDKATAYVGAAVDHMPGQSALLRIEVSMGTRVVEPDELEWRTILVSRAVPSDSGSAA